MSRKKRSLSIHGHRTSISLEPEFWAVIDQVAKQSGTSLAEFITSIDDKRTQQDSAYGLAAFLRLWVLRYVQSLIKPIDIS